MDGDGLGDLAGGTRASADEDGSIAISEVGARPPGAQFMSLMSFAHDCDLYAAWAELMVHGHFDPPEKRYACGAAYLRAMHRAEGQPVSKQATTIQGIDGVRRIADELGPIVVAAELPSPGSPPRSGYEGDGYVIVRHPRTEVVQQALHRIITTLRITAN